MRRAGGLALSAMLVLSACGSRRAPAEAALDWQSADGLPCRYFVVTAAATGGFASAGDVGRRNPEKSYGHGYGVAIVEERGEGAARVGRARSGLWLNMKDLAPAPGSAFAGVALRAGSSLPCWTREAGRQGALLGQEAEERRRSHDEDCASRMPRPSSVSPTERWIDVSLRSQTLVAYEGDRPVFATLISTGIGREGSPLATPRGTFRVGAKQATATMDNLEHDGVDRYYSMEDVPWVQWFAPGKALHGTYWHDGFGRPRSHGCINLSPLDARWLFEFTSPHLRAGRPEAVAKGDAGTVVRVRVW